MLVCHQETWPVACVIHVTFHHHPFHSIQRDFPVYHHYSAGFTSLLFSVTPSLPSPPHFAAVWSGEVRLLYNVIYISLQ